MTILGFIVPVVEYGGMSLLFARFSVFVATVFGVGYCPVAPGTAGTGVALLLFWLLRPDGRLQMLLAACIIIIGIIASHYADKSFGTKDSGRIVIDEVAGYAVAVLFLPMTPGYLIAGFLLFRVFDIVKPPPVRQIERALPGGLGVVMDDVAAGVYANLCLQLWKALV
jgi:phosphatidylglycerophosphatase A